MSRNAIKYQPFKPLEGHEEALREKEKNLEKITKPILSEDDFIRINNKLIEVINCNLVARFFIFKKDKIIQIDSKVNKVLNEYLYLDDVTIHVTDIIDIL